MGATQQPWHCQSGQLTSPASCTQQDFAEHRLAPALLGYPLNNRVFRKRGNCMLDGRPRTQTNPQAELPYAPEEMPGLGFVDETEGRL